MAYVHAEGDHRMILLANVADRKIIRWVDVSAETPRRLQWADDDALRTHKKEVELVTLRQGDRELSDRETRLQVLEATVAFLQAHDPPN